MLTLPRVPEKEAMASSEEIDAYAQSLLDPVFRASDEVLLAHVRDLGVRAGTALDVGTGPGQIPITLAQECPGLFIHGIDLSDMFLMLAARTAMETGVAGRTNFQRGDARHIPFGEDTFDLVVCNSVLHHFEDPVAALNEMDRVVKPGGALLVRDLRRPTRLFFRLHVRVYGRTYTDVMKQRYIDSVRAAYTVRECRALLTQSTITGATLFQDPPTHLGFYRAAGPAE